MDAITSYGESPGRLDFMGGVADYNGSLVLEMPIHAKTCVKIASIEQPVFIIKSDEFGSTTYPLKRLRILLTTYFENTLSIQNDFIRKDEEEMALLTTVHQHLIESDTPLWARYVIGCIIVYAVRKRWMLGIDDMNDIVGKEGENNDSGSSTNGLGLIIMVTSEVNINMGVSSSAALEIATLRAISSYAQQVRALNTGGIGTGLGFEGMELAHLGQLAENRIVGAPCGLMDQLSTAFGLPDHILPILCRPDILFDNIPIPEGVGIVGWPSGIKHGIGESPYMIARTASFMGKKIMEHMLQRKVQFTAEFTPSIIREGVVDGVHSDHKPATNHDSILELFPSFYTLLPLSMLGEDFLKQHGKVDDSLSVINPELYYPIRAAFNFPVNENFRTQLMATLLSTLSSTSNLPMSSSTTNSFSRQTILSQMGELLYQSHREYSTMGLGSAETDQIIEILQRLRHQGIYGTPP